MSSGVAVERSVRALTRRLMRSLKYGGTDVFRILYVIHIAVYTGYFNESCTGSRTGGQNSVDELLPGDKSCAFSVQTTKVIHVLEFVRSSPRHITLSPVVEVEVLQTLRLYAVTHSTQTVSFISFHDHTKTDHNSFAGDS